MKPIRFFAALFLAAAPLAAAAQIDTSVFSLLDLSRPGLERVAALHAAGNDTAAAQALLDHYRARTGVTCPEVDLQNPCITPDEQRWADEAMEHRFFVHTGYQPSYFYGDDIDWCYWPVKDNELRWQLHRMKWWVPMGKAYRLSGDERYAAEWCAEYVDWMRKNPLTVYDEQAIGSDKPGDGGVNWPQADNVYFAWRPLEVSDRLEFQIHQFLYFLPAKAFDAEFLTHFLVNYHRHAEHITRHFSAAGNHLLFQAQRLTMGGVFFPEFRDAARWRATGVEILNREIGRQVYPDGMQYELDPHYHFESINIFFKALQMMDANGYRGEFPDGYLDTVHRMIVIQYNYTFPDYTMPMFSDCKLHDKSTTLPSYKEWAEVFPNDPMIRHMATEGREGAVPNYLSHAFPDGGFYILRNGWDADATVMVLKAGPQAFWHCQPDNGTFELWHAGRNFFPDSGSFVYAGGKEVNVQRNWFRQTRVHNTLTLDDRNLEKTDSKCIFRGRYDGTSDGEANVVVVENPSYEGLTHRRAAFFVDRRFYVLVDEAYGDAEGDVALHYNLVECDPAEDVARNRMATQFGDGNDLVMQVFGAQPVTMARREGWVSRTYRQRSERPAYAFSSHKNPAQTLRYITLLIPASKAGKVRAKAQFRGGFSAHGTTSVRVVVDGKKYDLTYNLKQTEK